jgi:glycosyltransferase involved in cell wall biosynthesis
MHDAHSVDSGPHERCLISIILSQKNYPDRFKMLYALGDHVDRHVIITRDEVRAAPHGDHVRVITPAEPLRGLTYWAWVSGVVEHLVTASSDKQWLVHEHVIGVASFFLHRRMSNPPPTIVSVYAAEVSFLRDRAWKVDPHASNVGLDQQAYYLYRYLRKSIFHWFSWLDADIVTGNSQKVVDDISIFFPNRATRVVPTAIDPDSLGEAGDPPQWRTEGLEVLFVGDLRTFKGVATLCRAMRLLLDRGAAAEALLVGGQYPVDDHWVDEMISEYDVAECVRRTGKIPKSSVIAAYREADVFVCPSFHEGSPRVVKEALLCGCPVIASDIPGVRIIDPDAEVVTYFDPGDADALCARLQQFADQPSQDDSFDERARTVVHRFTPDKIAARFADLYDDLIASAKLTATHT